MKVIPPLLITNSMLTSTIAEPDSSVGEVSWVSGTSYPIGSKVILTSTHGIYEKITANITTSLTTSPDSNTTDWLDIGPTNKWAMFTNTRSNGSISSSNITIVINPNISSINRVNSLVILRANVTNISITITAGLSTVYSYSTTVSSADFNMVKFDLPPVSNAILTLVLTVPGSGGSIGNVILGQYVELGDIQKGISLEQLNFSTITRDAFGNSLLVPRRSLPKTTQKTLIPKYLVDNLIDVRAKLNAVPAIWIGLEDTANDLFDALLILGVYKEFSYSMEYPDHAVVSLQLEEI